MAIAERARAVGMLVSYSLDCLYGSCYSLSLTAYLAFIISYFCFRKFATWMIFQISLESGMSIFTPDTPTNGTGAAKRTRSIFKTTCFKVGEMK
jgi:hypothetical protein